MEIWQGTAFAVLNTIENCLASGIQRDAVQAVKEWIQENMPPDFDEETKARIQRIYDESNDEGEQKALEWAAQGGTPQNGARIQVPFVFSANENEWQPENGLPPVWTPEHYLPKSDAKFSDNDEENL